MPRVSLAPPSLLLPLLSVLGQLLPSLPPTVRDVDVPPLFRERFILSGYRPVGLSWRCYILSLFQIHNETLNVWSHLLAAVAVLTRFLFFTVFQGGGVLGVQLQGPEGQGFSVDASSLPLVLYVLSAFAYLSCSAAAHLLQSHSVQAHYTLFLLDYVGVGVYQFGCALALSLYCSEPTWTQSIVGQLYLPAAAFLAWFSCTACCFAKLHFRRPYPLHRKLFQVLPMGLAYLLDISPVAHRLSSCSWTSGAAGPLHSLQVVLFLLGAFFFSCPVPERFSPGSFDVIGHSHQLFHFLLSFCTLAQLEALLVDFVWRRPALVRRFGEDHLYLACAAFAAVTLCCSVTAFTLRQQAQEQLSKELR